MLEIIYITIISDRSLQVRQIIIATKLSILVTSIPVIHNTSYLSKLDETSQTLKK